MLIRSTLIRCTKSKIFCRFLPVTHLHSAKQNQFWNSIREHYAPENFKMLRKYGVEILQFNCYSDFSWNQILVNSKGQRTSFLAIVMVLNLNLSSFSRPKFTKIQSWESQKLYECLFLIFKFCQNWFHTKLSGK